MPAPSQHYANNPLALPPCNPGGAAGYLLWGTGFEEYYTDFLGTFQYEDHGGLFLRDPYWRDATGYDAPSKTGLVHLELGYDYDPLSSLPKWLGQGFPTTAVHCHARGFAATAIDFPLIGWYDGTPTRIVDADWQGMLAEGELTAQATLWGKVDGRIELRQGFDGTVLWTSDAPLLRLVPNEFPFPVDPDDHGWWVHLQARLTVDSAAGTFDLWYDDGATRSQIVALTGLDTQVTGNAQATVIVLGSPVDLDPDGTLPDHTWFVDIDNWGITDGPLLGEVMFERLTVTGEVATGGFPWEIATAPTYGFPIADPQPTVWESVADPIRTSWTGTSYRPWEFGEDGAGKSYVVAGSSGLATNRFALSDPGADARPGRLNVGLWSMVAARRRRPDTLGGVPDGLGSIEPRLAFGTALTYYPAGPHSLELFTEADRTLSTPTGKAVSGEWVADDLHNYRDWWAVNPATAAAWTDAELADLVLEVHSGDPVTEFGYGLVLVARTVLNPQPVAETGLAVQGHQAWRQVPQPSVQANLAPRALVPDGLWRMTNGQWEPVPFGDLCPPP